MSEEGSGSLDAWGWARREAIEGYRRSAVRAMADGNRGRSGLWGIAESAAEYAPKTKPGAVLEVASMVTPLAITKLAKIAQLGHLYETVGAAQRAGKIYGIARDLNVMQGLTQGAKAVTNRHFARTVLSAGHYGAELAHYGSSIVHSVHHLGEWSVDEFKRVNFKRVNSSLAASHPVVEQGIVHKGGMVEFPKSRQFVMPPITITPNPHPKHKVAIPHKAHSAAQAGIGGNPMRLTLPRLGDSLKPHFGFNIPKLSLGSISDVAHAAAHRPAVSSASTHMRLTPSDLSKFLHRGASPPGSPRPSVAPVLHPAASKSRMAIGLARPSAFANIAHRPPATHLPSRSAIPIAHPFVPHRPPPVIIRPPNFGPRR